MPHHYLPTAGAVVADLRERRIAAGLSQIRLAVAAGIHVNTVCRAEAGLPVVASSRAAIEQALARAAAPETGA